MICKFLVRAQRTVGLCSAPRFEPALRGEWRPQMESFCRVSGNTGPHASAGRRRLKQLSGNGAAQRRLELVNDAHRSFRADLIGVEKPAGYSIQGDSESDVTMMGVQIHAHAAQSSERALPAVRRLRVNEHSADHDVRPEVYPF